MDQSKESLRRLGDEAHGLMRSSYPDGRVEDLLQMFAKLHLGLHILPRVVESCVGLRTITITGDLPDGLVEIRYQ